MARNSIPNEAQRNQLAKEVGLEPKQIKHWFDNKRTTLKVIFFSLTHIVTPISHAFI